MINDYLQMNAQTVLNLENRKVNCHFVSQHALSVLQIKLLSSRFQQMSTPAVHLVLPTNSLPCPGAAWGSDAGTTNG